MLHLRWVVVRISCARRSPTRSRICKPAADRRDEDPQWYAEARLHARRLLREYGVTERDTDAVLGALAWPVE